MNKITKSIEEIEDELDELQLSYINEDDERVQMAIISRFTQKLQEATLIDNIDRLANNVTIHNWRRNE